MGYGVGPGPRYGDKEGEEGELAEEGQDLDVASRENIGKPNDGGSYKTGNLKSGKTVGALAFRFESGSGAGHLGALRSAARRLRDPTSALARLPLSAVKKLGT